MTVATIAERLLDRLPARLQAPARQRVAAVSTAVASRLRPRPAPDLAARRRPRPAPRDAASQRPEGAPLVTVGITSHHEAERIGRCLESLVEQTLGAEQIEVLVVDDGSTDDTVETAWSYADAADWAAFTVTSHAATGSPSAGRNRIVDAAAGEHVFLLDADDYLGRQALEAMTRAAARESADVVVGRYVGVNRSAPNVLPPKKATQRRDDYHPGWLNSLHVQKLFRTEFLRDLGCRFNESLIYASDHPYMISVFLHARAVAFVDDVDCYFLTLEEPSSTAASARPGRSGRTGRRTHVSRAEIPARRQLQFLHDCFGVLALARGEGGEAARRAGRMRAHYWNRLLKVHLPVLVRRKTDDDAVVDLAREATALAELYGAETSRTTLVPEARLMLEAFASEDAATIRAAAEAARGVE
ncbi:glycosyltransferase family A protein [Nesterenkonia halobia]|uniref:Glycosyltransferase 2-like domain-containing protein n=1 Tax=Nesterenkonia halobia TaxID=37922 RepID=A0ABP6RBU9_9MICC